MAAVTDAGPGARGSALAIGTVRHRRHRPTRNAFRYRTYHVLLDVDELAVLDHRVGGFGYGRAAPTSFHDRDHFGPLDLPVREKLRRWLRTHGRDLPGGPVRVLTNLRVFGHVFNPVSWWFCHEPDGRLAFVVAEVANTFGESHVYLLDDLRRHPDGTLRTRRAKSFHVSPFLPIDGLVYDFVFRLRDDRVLVHLDVRDDDGVVLDATQAARLTPLTTRTLTRALVTHPLTTVWTVVRIHRQALRLWRRRVTFFRKPPPPPDGFDRIDRPEGFEPGPGPTVASQEHVA